MNKHRFFRSGLYAALLLGAVLSLSACGANTKTEASYPDRQHGSDKILYSDQKRDTVWGKGVTLGDKIFGRDKDQSNGAGIGVNSFLWRASLDTISLMPVASADPFGGTILTDWYESPDHPGERFKIDVYILDRTLRADGVRVAVFKQTKDATGDWHDDKTPAQMSTDIENAILTRARELRVAQLGRTQQ